METIRIVVVGCAGARGSWFVQVLAQHPVFQIAALVDNLPGAAQLVANHLNLCDIPLFEDTVAALDSVVSDAVLIATPDGQHITAVIESLRRGKYVYVEKPLAISGDDCLAIIEADRIAGGRTMVGFNLRYAPVYRQIRQLIREGAVGRVLTIQADEFYYGGCTYFRRWNRLRHESGGLWITKASHDFDLLYWMADAFPVRVMAATRLTHYRKKPEAGQRCRECNLEANCPEAYSRTNWDSSPMRTETKNLREAVGGGSPDLCLYNSDKDTFDHGQAIVEFANEVLATYSLNVVASFTDRRMVVAGTEGTLEGSISAGGEGVWYWRRHQGDDPNRRERIVQPTADLTTDGAHGGGDARLLDSFAAFVAGQNADIIGPAEASVAVAIGLAATQASEHGGACPMEDVAGWAELSRAQDTAGGPLK